MHIMESSNKEHKYIYIEMLGCWLLLKFNFYFLFYITERKREKGLKRHRQIHIHANKHHY